MYGQVCKRYSYCANRHFGWGGRLIRWDGRFAAGHALVQELADKAGVKVHRGALSVPYSMPSADGGNGLLLHVESKRL